MCKRREEGETGCNHGGVLEAGIQSPTLNTRAMEKRFCPSGNSGVVLASRAELFLLWFPPTAAPFNLFYGRIIPQFIGGLLLWESLVHSEEAEQRLFYFHICLLVFHQAVEV